MGCRVGSLESGPGLFSPARHAIGVLPERASGQLGLAIAAGRLFAATPHGGRQRSPILQTPDIPGCWLYLFYV
jgi:hypothetical protein